MSCPEDSILWYSSLYGRTGCVLIEDVRTEEAGGKTEKIMEGHAVEPEAFTSTGRPEYSAVFHKNIKGLCSRPVEADSITLLSLCRDTLLQIPS